MYSVASSEITRPHVMIAVNNKGMCMFGTPSAGSLLPVRMIMRKTSMTVLNDIGIARRPNQGG